MKLTPEQREKVAELIQLIGGGVAERLVELLPALRAIGTGQQPFSGVLRPNDPISQAVLQAQKPAQVYRVVREDPDTGEPQEVDTTVPQLLAELNDRMLELVDITERKKRRR